MDWLDEANAEVKAIRERERLIVEEQEQVYESLWKELRAHIDAATKSSFPRLFTNGRQLARMIKLPVPPIPPNMEARPKTVEISLVKEEHQITAVGDGVDVVLSVDVCDDGVVCLKLDGKQTTLKDAAIAILRPFLFPELYPNARTPGIY